LVFSYKRADLYEGAIRPAGHLVASGGMNSPAYWCRFDGEPRNVLVTGLRTSIRRLDRNARTRRSGLAQRVVIEGTLSERNPEPESIESLQPIWVIDSTHVGILEHSTIVSAEPVFCRGATWDADSRQ
jgi:hypothetical protein